MLFARVRIGLMGIVALGDVVNGVNCRLDLVGILVWDLDAEFLL